MSLGTIMRIGEIQLEEGQMRTNKTLTKSRKNLGAWKKKMTVLRCSLIAVYVHHVYSQKVTEIQDDSRSYRKISF